MTHKLLDEYENLKEIGQGSFARVYKVRHLELNYIRAIRILNSPVSNEQDRPYQTFLKECKTLLQLGNGGHPNIVRIYQPRLLQNHALVEMDYIEGRDLDEYLKSHNGFVPIGEVLRFAHDICGALAYCHVDNYEFSYDVNKEYEYKLDGPKKGKKFRIEPDPNDGSKDRIDDLQRRELIREYGITHNDLHSRNIMRKNYDGSYILLDFGLAIQNGQAVKSSSRQDGAIEYKAPEKGERGAEISPRSDIYGFGILLYEMLAGRVPFPYDRDKYSREEEALFRLSKQHEEDTPPAIEPLRRAAFEAANPGKKYEKDYPEWLEQIILRCLNKEPQDRYANAKELSTDLKNRMASTNKIAFTTVNELRAENKNLLKQVESLKSENKILNNELIDLKSKNESICKELSSIEYKNVILERDINTLKKLRPQRVILMSLCIIFAVSTTFLGVLSGKQPTTLQTHSGIGVYELSVLEAKAAKSEELQTQLDDANTGNKRLIAENQTLKSESSNNIMLADKQQEIDQLQLENATLKADLRNVTASQSTSSSNQQEINMLNASIQENNRTIANLRQEISKLQQEINTQKATNQEMDGTITNLKRELQTAQATIDRLLR